MKQKVKYSPLSLALTGIALIIFLCAFVDTHDNIHKLVLFSILIGCVMISALYYCPTSVTVSESGITLHRLLGKKVFGFNDILSVDTCYPSAGGIRLCGSGGFFGYWGYFNDIMIGTYFGYYGSRSHCFLIKLKNGRQYVLGCDNPAAIVNYLYEKLR